MLVESLIKATVNMQGFKVRAVRGSTTGLVAALGPDRRYAPRCSGCGEPASHRDTRGIRYFSARTVVGYLNEPELSAASGELPELRRSAYRADSVGIGETPIYSRAYGDAGNVVTHAAVAAGSEVVWLRVGHGGYPRSTRQSNTGLPSAIWESSHMWVSMRSRENEDMST